MQSLPEVILQKIITFVPELMSVSKLCAKAGNKIMYILTIEGDFYDDDESELYIGFTKEIAYRVFEKASDYAKRFGGHVQLYKNETLLKEFLKEFPFILKMCKPNCEIVKQLIINNYKTAVIEFEEQAQFGEFHGRICLWYNGNVLQDTEEEQPRQYGGLEMGEGVPLSA